MKDCAIIFPFQLFEEHPALAKGRPVFLIEDSLSFGDRHVRVKFHQQKLVLHRASMKAYAAQLKRLRFDVRYIEHGEGRTIGEQLAELCGQGFDHFHLCEPVDDLLERRLARFERQTGARVKHYDTPMFLTPAEELGAEFCGNRRPFMARFYKAQRLRMGILVDAGGEPAGGQWSFDVDNRKPMPKHGLEVPADPAAAGGKMVDEAIAYVRRRFGDCYGDAGGFAYPVTHATAEAWFESFLVERFALFGDYEDAIAASQRVLFHGVLTPMLNIGLLTPGKVIERALEFAQEAGTPLNSVEGFVRQIIGWREFMRGAYQHLGVECRNGNFWGFEDRPVPVAFYEASTGIPPVDDAIRRALDHGWCHHIERLMILGNFMLLCGLHPRRVYDWFMELFVDAYDWVMVPNVFGMSQFADGGLFTTKPYISGSNYVLKMSDYRRGDWCAVWDGLFWSFISTHREFFQSQHRLGMMVRQLDKMPEEKLRSHFEAAQGFLASLR